mmetsp:Transcript_20995/g.64185  ORF Transcript_20995/g.64185 Transcript_20995/m.64185 type:complete len:181 (-) Transcript_20995:623-1165(-)
MDYSKWDRFHVDDSDDESGESDSEREIQGGKWDPGHQDRAVRREVAVDKAQAAADTLVALTRVERIAEDVLAERQQMIELDRRRNHNREALAALRRIERQGKSVAVATKHWICLGDVFMKRPHVSTKEMLEEDGRRLDREIEALRESVKKKTSELCELDPSMCVSFCLRALSRSERFMEG